MVTNNVKKEVLLLYSCECWNDGRKRWRCSPFIPLSLSHFNTDGLASRINHDVYDDVGLDYCIIQFM